MDIPPGGGRDGAFVFRQAGAGGVSTLVFYQLVAGAAAAEGAVAICDVWRAADAFDFGGVVVWAGGVYAGDRAVSAGVGGDDRGAGSSGAVLCLLSRFSAGGGAVVVCDGGRAGGGGAAVLARSASGGAAGVGGVLFRAVVVFGEQADSLPAA